MGRSKADLDFGGITILKRIVVELRSAFRDIVIAVAPGDSRTVAHARVIRDEQEYEGPLAALARGLRAIQNEAAFTCSCDLPFVSSQVALQLCAMLNNYDAFVPEIDGLAQPLPAVYRKRRCEAIDRMIAKGEKRLTRII